AGRNRRRGARGWALRRARWWRSPATRQRSRAPRTGAQRSQRRSRDRQHDRDRDEKEARREAQDGDERASAAALAEDPHRLGRLEGGQDEGPTQSGRESRQAVRIDDRDPG